jgi:hypothetical protein
MIKFEDSEKAINGLAKIIAQDPTFSIKLRNAKKRLLEEKALINDEEYFVEQEEILRRAEKIGLSSTGYIFQVYTEEGREQDNYMVYKKIGNEMVPIREEFKKNPQEAILFPGLVSYLNGHHINSLITFMPSFQDKFYSCPWFEKGETEQDDSWGNDAQHVEVSFDREELRELKENGIKFQIVSQSEAWEFNLNLKDLVKS